MGNILIDNSEQENLITIWHSAPFFEKKAPFSCSENSLKFVKEST